MVTKLAIKAKLFRMKYGKKIAIAAVMLVLLLGAAIVFFASGKLGGTFTGGSNSELERAVVIHVTDGDTLVVQREVEGPEKVRLISVDTPESVAFDASRNSEEGEIAAAFTRDLVHEGQTVWLQKDVSETDKYGRLLRYVWLEKPSDAHDKDQIAAKMLNAILVRNGYAQVKRYEPDIALYEYLKELEKQAVAAHKGVSYLWSATTR